MTPDFEDCTDVLRSLYAFHDNELTQAEADDIREHLMACEPCLDHYPGRGCAPAAGPPLLRPGEGP